MDLKIVDKGAPKVLFIGGPLDGQYLPLQELGEAYSVENLRPPLRLRSSDEEPDAPGESEFTEYVRTEKDGVFYYVDRELWDLSNAQGIDPVP